MTNDYIAKESNDNYWRELDEFTRSCGRIVVS